MLGYDKPKPMIKSTDALQVEVRYNANPPDADEQQSLVQFLSTHLGPYGDPKEHIANAIDYACGDQAGQGGFVLIGQVAGHTKGVVVVNKTGMSGYIPSNILVYIAVDQSDRGRGYGALLMQHALKLAQGGMALHVEPDNPARKLYERLGFTNKYLEMRHTAHR